MKRRDALKLLVVLPGSSRIRYFGAIPRRSDRQPFQVLFGQYNNIGQGKRALLWKFFELATNNPLIPHNQDNAPDCVGQATGLACDILAACDIYMRFERERWIEKSSVEMIYAGSRNEIGGGKLGRRGGSHGEWAVRFLKEYGVLHRLPYYDGNNNIDLTGYDPRRTAKYANNGVPDWLESFAKKHPVQTYSKITSFKEACDALYVGQPIIMCCSYAFPNQRDSQGFSKPYLGYRREKWYHAWCLCGYDDTGSRPGGLIMNSHGIWNNGPRRFDQPDGSHWVDAQYLDMMLKEWEDSYAISAYVGYPQRMLNHRLY